MIYNDIPEDAKAGRSEAQALNALQDFGVISDNAVWWTDVGDTEKAIEWLRANPGEKGA